MTATPAERVRPARWVPAWVAPVSLVLVAGGLAVSIDLTITHYTTSVRLACSASGVIDCQKVTTSPQSFIAGVPVAVLGVAFFVVFAVLCLPAAWRSGEPAVRYARIGLAVAGVLTVVRLVYAELLPDRRDLPVVHRRARDQRAPLRRRPGGGGAGGAGGVRHPGAVISAPMTSPPTSTTRWWVLAMVAMLLAALVLVIYVSK